MKKVPEFLSVYRPFYLAGIAGDQAEVRPVGFIMEFAGKLYLGAGARKEIYRQMQLHPDTNSKARFCGASVSDCRLSRKNGKAAYHDSAYREAAKQTFDNCGQEHFS